MTTATVTKALGYRYDLADYREHLRSMWQAAGDWVRQTRANLEDSRIERWNSERLAMMESRGGTRYK